MPRHIKFRRIADLEHRVAHRRQRVVGIIANSVPGQRSLAVPFRLFWCWDRPWCLWRHNRFNDLGQDRQHCVSRRRCVMREVNGEVPDWIGAVGHVPSCVSSALHSPAFSSVGMIWSVPLSTILWVRLRLPSSKRAAPDLNFFNNDSFWLQ